MSDLIPFATLALLPDPVLSVYLDTNPVRHLNRNSEHGFHGWFSGHAKRLLAVTPSSERSRLATEISRVEHFLAENPSKARGVAIFAGPAVWHVIHLPIEPHDELHWGKPMLWQLVGIADRHRPACIVSVHRSGVRLFSYHGGEVVLLHTLEFRVDASHWKRMQAFHSAERKAGMPHGPQQDLFKRRRDSHYLRFLAETAHEVTHACQVHGLDQVLLLGPSRYTGIIAHKLPPFLGRHTIQIPDLWRESDSAMLQSSVGEALSRFESARQEELLAGLRNRGPSVVTGVEETLALLQRGRLRVLLADASFNPLLRYCTTCDSVSASAVQECPRCHRHLLDLTLHEILPQLLTRYSCATEFLYGKSADGLRCLGSIGGWLRQRQPTDRSMLSTGQGKSPQPVTRLTNSRQVSRAGVSRYR